MKKTLKTIITLTLCLAILLFASGCSSKSDKTIAVGSKDFTESFILAELYSLGLEDAGFTVERKYNLGGTNVAQAAMLKSDIQLYPEYTGTGLLQILKLPVMTDSKEVYEKVASEYKSQFGLVWLQPTIASNSQGLAITKSASDEYGILTISDLQKQSSNIKFASLPLFMEVEDGIKGLTAAYGEFEFAEIKLFDNALRYQVLENGQMDLTVAFTTDGILSSPDFVVLEDDLKVWPPYNIAPVIRQDTLDENPEIEQILNSISKLLDNATMQKLNGEVDLNQREYEEVAKEFYENNVK